MNAAKPTHKPFHHKENPYTCAPMPSPMDGYSLRAPELFTERALANHLQRNAAWLQARPRTSEAIEAALYPEYQLCGMEPEEVRLAINAALWEAGYSPSTTCSDNPMWHWLEGEQPQGHKEGHA